MACRFPGNANDPRAFWELLRNGVDAITEVPPDRWNASRFYHTNAAAPGRMVTQWGGFIQNPDLFDATFFGIAPREASRMDPQHRWLLETSWEALEDAGLPPEKLAGSRTGVFVGISYSDYASLHRRDTSSLDGYTNIGSALSIAANRISFFHNLRGPSLAVDTACSSSLVALHFAAQSLWSGEYEAALVCGANALLTPEATIGFSQAHMLSPRGRCRAFDAEADGYVRAEGAAAVLLMRWQTAQTLKIPARALLVATASNQDGHSSSLTVPNQQAQEQMIRDALQSAGADPRDVVYVEAHGTGTPVGDPVEALALAAVLAHDRPPDEPLLIGSVKTNIGHLEPASGLAGLIKAVLILEQRAIPPSLHFETPNALLPVNRVSVPVALTPLPCRAGRTPLVAVNSFGFGGTNAHALLAPAPASKSDEEIADEPCIFPVSARSPRAMAHYARAYAHFIAASAPDSFSLRDLCTAAALEKSHHPLRHALVADSLTSLKDQLLEFSRSTVDAKQGPARPKIAFVFSGQGSQWWAMGRQLYRSERLVREIWEQCDATCQQLGGPKLLDALLADEAASQLNYTEIAQAALFTLQVSLVKLWHAWGIDADAVIGDSVGEIAAACTAGVLDLATSFRIILTRSHWQAKMRGLGRMLAASISTDDAKNWERKFAGRISIAAFNAPRQVILAGDAIALEQIAQALKHSEVFCQFLQTEYAFHSQQMDAIEDGLLGDLPRSAGSLAKLPMISTVTGRPVKGPELNADYWWRNVREPVLFSSGVARLLRDGCTALVEIGPHPVMAAALAEIALTEKSSALSVASLRRGEDDRSMMLRGLATLYRHGVAVRWEALYTRAAQTLRLPAYPWQRQRLWLESPEAARELRSAPSHPLLGDRQHHPQPTWMNRLDTRLLPWLADHQIAGSIVVPAACFLEMAAAAVREFTGEPVVFLEDIKFHHVLFLPNEGSVPTCARIDPAGAFFQIFSGRLDTPNQWQLHAEGHFRPARLHVPPPADIGRLGEECPDKLDPQALYRGLSNIGQVYGPSFRGLASVQVNANHAVLSTVVSSANRGWPDYLVFPPALDSSIHSAFALRSSKDTRPNVVVSLRQLRIFHPLPENARSHLRIVERGENIKIGDVTLYDPSGTVVAQLDGLKLRALDAQSKPGQHERKFYRFAWEPLPMAALRDQNATSEEVLIFADRGEFGLALAASLGKRKIATKLIFRDTKPAHCPDGDALTVDLGQRDWAIRLWNTLSVRGRTPTQMIYLWAWEGEDSCSAFLALTQARLAMQASQNQARWLVATHRAQAVHDRESITPAPATLWGFVRSVQTEQPQWNISLVDCDSPSPEPLLGELFAAEVEPEVALRDDGRRVRRLRQFRAPNSVSRTRPPAYGLQLKQPGRIDSLQFVGRARLAPGPGEVEVEVAAAGLNFRDLMKALGLYPLRDGESSSLGDEFSGRVTRVGRQVRNPRVGDRVAGFAPAGEAFASHLIVGADAVWTIPPHLGFAEAASIPVVFGTAYHALHTLARLRRGETVLIHAAAGGVGLAAVQIAQQLGARVLATAGNEEKRAWLRSLGVPLVMDSRTLDFADETLRYTAGRGVDVVLNSLAGAFQQKSLDVCAPHGRFVEIGKRDLYENNSLSLATFQRSLSFSAFDLSTVLASRSVDQRVLLRFLANGFARGKLQPIPCTSFSAGDAVSAFRHMQAAQHIGKIIIEFNSEQVPDVIAEFWPDPEGTYLITGGLSGFGFATAHWLVERGARHLALLSRRGIVSPEITPYLDAMRKRGISIAVISTDVADAKALAAELHRLKRKAPPLRGLFHSAMVLRDRRLGEMTQEDLAAVLAPKMKGAWNLHMQTRDLPLDCFTMFSSISSVVGTPGQANYAAANAFLDALAHHRHAEGLPALSINWGRIADVGVAAKNPAIGRYLDEVGVTGLSSREALATLPRLIANDEIQIGVMEVDWNRTSRASKKFGNSLVFRDLVQSETATRPHTQVAGDWCKIVFDLPREEQVAAITRLVIEQISESLAVPPADIDPAGPLVGMDSLMAIELSMRLEEYCGCQLPMNALSANMTPAQLAERLLKLMGQSVPEPQQKTPAASARAPVELTSALVRNETLPLFDLIQAGEMEPLTAGALMAWPTTLFEQSGVPSDAFFERMHNGRVSLDLVLETALGSVGIFSMPLTTSQVRPGEPSLLGYTMEGIRLASTCGAKCVALTGLIPSATNHGALVHTACANRSDLAPVTTGHATTVAAVLLNLSELLRKSGRKLRDETVMFYGIGSIGLGALRLMLDVLQHPAELHLCDPFRSAHFFSDLEQTLRREHAYEGVIKVFSARDDDAKDFYEASVIVGATNVEDQLDIERLAPGTLVVDDSSPHCMNGSAALARFAERKDILFTEGGFVRGGAPIPRTMHIPPAVAASMPPQIPHLFFNILDPSTITACILSALLSARRPQLAPTVGSFELAVSRQHWAALAELEFSAADLNYEGFALDPAGIVAFREHFGGP